MKKADKKLDPKSTSHSENGFSKKISHHRTKTSTKFDITLNRKKYRKKRTNQSFCSGSDFKSQKNRSRRSGESENSVLDHICHKLQNPSSVSQSEVESEASYVDNAQSGVRRKNDELRQLFCLDQ